MSTKKSYKQLRTELDELLSWFDGDDIDVDEAIVKYETALALTKNLATHLTEAENKLSELKATLPE